MEEPKEGCSELRKHEFTAIAAVVPVFRPTCYTLPAATYSSALNIREHEDLENGGEDTTSVMTETKQGVPKAPTCPAPVPPRFEDILVSILMPVHNAAPFLDEMLTSLLAQTYPGSLELIVFNDGPSTDSSLLILQKYDSSLKARSIQLVVESSPPGSPLRGCGYGRNAAARKARGSFFCFADADDVMMPTRIERQMQLAVQSHRLLVGSNFTRQPEGATPRFTLWANGLSQAQLYTQQLVETTLVTPTWLCSRKVFQTSGPFHEGGPGTPDDLLFFYKHIGGGGHLAKVEESLVMYRFHSASVTGSRGVSRDAIFAVRVRHLEGCVLNLPPWRDGWTIWNAGREGKRVYRSLQPHFQRQVAAFCDADPRKVLHGYYIHMPTQRRVPVIHWTVARPPLLICCKRGLGEGDVEANVRGRGFREGSDFVFFC